MTTDELERDLATLAEPRPEDEHVRRAIRAMLGEQLQDRRPATRRRRRFAFGSVAVAAAAIAAAVVALIGTGGSSSANAAILAHVVRASGSPANIIVHVKEVGGRDGTQVSAEWWQETNAPYAMRLIKGPASQEVESAADGTTYSRYDAATNTIYRQADSATPTLVDPVENLRAELAAGTARVVGTVTIDGRSLYRLELPSGVVGYFDRTNYRPVYIDNPQRGGNVVRTRVVAYEELPITPQNENLLTLTAHHPDARIAAGAAPAPTKQPGDSK